MHEAYIKGEPTPCRAKKDLRVLPLGEVDNEVALGCLGRNDALDDRIGIHNERAIREEVLDIRRRLLDVAFNVHSETRSLRDRETEVEGDCSGDTSKTDEETPAEVDVTRAGRVIVDDGVLESRDDYERYDGSGCSTGEYMRFENDLSAETH